MGDLYSRILQPVSAGGAVGVVLSPAAPEPAEPTHPALTLTDLLTLARQKNLAAASLLGFCIQILTYDTVYGFTPLAARQIGASHWELGLMQTLFILPGIVASTLSGTYFAARFGERSSVAAGFAASAAAYAVIPWLTDIDGFYLSQALGGGVPAAWFIRC